MPAAREPSSSRQEGARARGAAVREARPRLAVGWLVTTLMATLVLRHPAALAGLLLGVLLLARDLGSSAAVWRLLRWAVPFAVLLLVIQVLVDRNGLTVFARLGDSGFLGELDLTLEALVGATAQALRVLAGITVSGLALALLDVDRVLGSVRRYLPRFGILTTLALRLAPAIAADGRRYADGLRARADGGRLEARDRMLVVEALLGRTLDRAADAATILELRGLGRPARRTVASDAGVAWSRLEQAVGVSIAGTVATLAVIAFAGLDRFNPYPLLQGSPAIGAFGAGLAVAGVAGLPLAWGARRMLGRA